MRTGQEEASTPKGKIFYFSRFVVVLILKDLVMFTC